MKRYAVPAVFLALAACSSANPRQQGSGSLIASVDIGDLSTTGNLPWASMTLDVKRADDGSLVTSLSALKRQFEGGQTAFPSVKIPYGRYTFDLQYKSADGVLLYESCNKAQIQDVEVPVYRTAVDICPVGSGTPVGSTPIQPTSDVTIEPKAPAATPTQPSTPPTPPTTPTNPGSPAPVGSADREIVAYYQTWSAGWASDGKQMSLAKLPPYITTVLLSFATPGATYAAGQRTWAGTGLSFSSDFSVVVTAIQQLKANNPRTKVLLSVGGDTFKTGWAQANPQAVAALVKDLGADGADLDYEQSGDCTWASGGTSCATDQAFIGIINSFRSALPRPLVLTTAAWSTGAFGAGRFAVTNMSTNVVGPNFGLYINPLKAVGNLFDAVFIMSYDAGSPAAPSGNATGYDPKLAFDAYRDLYKGPLMLGVEIPPEAWGGNVSTPQEAQQRAQYVIEHGGQGMMIWSLQKTGTTPASDFVQAMCQTLNLPGCSISLVL